MAHVATHSIEHSRRPQSEGFIAKCVLFFAIFGAAIRVAGAAESRQRPDAEDLQTLGIKPSSFPSL